MNSEYTCKHCKASMGASCSDKHCHDCADNCVICEKKLSTQYDLYYNQCEIGASSGIYHECYTCEKAICSEHYIECIDCGGELCTKCIQTHRRECAVCKEIMCEEYGAICSFCGCFRCYDAGCAYGDCICRNHK